MADIEIVQKADGSIEPKQGFRVTFHRGASVMFTAPGSKGLTIEFVGPSPFLDPSGQERKHVPYGEELTISNKPGVFGFICEIEKNGQKLRTTKKPVGGEIEVPPIP